MNIWEHQAEAKALAAAEKVAAAAAKETKVLVEHNEAPAKNLGGKLVDELKSAAGAVEQGIENFVHEHLGAASPQGSSVPATPEQTPPAEVHAELSEERKAELLAEMKALEAEIAGL